MRRGTLCFLQTSSRLYEVLLSHLHGSSSVDVQTLGSSAKA